MRLLQPRPLDEQTRRLVRRNLLRRDIPVRVRHRKRRHPIGQLTGNSQPLPAGDQDDEMRTVAQQNVSQLRAALEYVLSVVQHHKQMSGREVFGQRLGQILARLLLDPEDVRDLLRYQARICQRCELHEPAAIRIPLDHIRGEMHRQACLAASARTRERE